MNIQTVIGRLGDDAKPVKTPKAEFVCFSLAAVNGYGERKKTEWVDCVMYGRTGVLPYLKKGTQVFVSGECWSEAFGGQTRRKMQVNQLELTGSGAK